MANYYIGADVDSKMTELAIEKKGEDYPAISSADHDSGSERGFGQYTRHKIPNLRRGTHGWMDVSQSQR